ncbi:trypsin-like peptidase domain-containing protein [Streptomyces iconiensis]|uniref:Trypsin-like peptidase domain-containing protein n=1 Tax=Streptomyces iconiensis TaxID=1384038 RepID=A0ABT7A707_9ACTN|nr:trypsin-like peptidase domain-containing protein [Streptomyces iconiensis]MDJ1137099.1 hypothetical protein [Streptomyces iconiensis]
MSRGHWVHMYQADTYLGAGFLITRGFVLTALHCLRGLSHDDATLALELPDGRRVRGRKCDAVKERDLALVTIEDAHAHGLPAAPRTDTARPAVAWYCRYRPPHETAQLSGQVTHAPVDHRCVEGGELEAMQLQVDQILGSFAGYSGGPVEAGERHAGEGEGEGGAGTVPGTDTRTGLSGDPGGDPAPAPGAGDGAGDGSGDERPVVGILLEQQLNRQDATLGSNVLFAATVRYAMELFPHFGVEHLRALVSAPRPGPSRSAADVPPQRSQLAGVENDQLISGANSLLVSLRQWEESGLITAADAEENRSRTLKRLTDKLLGDQGR